MGTLTEVFSNLTDLLLTDGPKALGPRAKESERDILLSRWLRPFLPHSIRCGAGTLLDAKDRQVGPLDVIAAWEAYPPLGEALATAYPVDGVVFCLQARHWAKEDLTQFAKTASDIRKLDRSQARPLFCGAVSFDALSIEHVLEFMRSPAGTSIDGVLSIGHNVVIRNPHGAYGDPVKVPFVTERGGAESLKAFTLCLLQQAQSFVGMPFGLGNYQHL